MLTLVLLVATVAAFAIWTGDALRVMGGGAAGEHLLDEILFVALVAFLAYGNLVYQASRLGYLARRRDHREMGPGERSAIHLDGARPLTILVPAYREEPRVVRQTLLSAALQEYPTRRVVLLIDDPPVAPDAATRALLDAARALPREVERLLHGPAARLRMEHAAFERRVAAARGWSPDVVRHELQHAARLSDRVAGWFDRRARSEPVRDHTDAAFAEQVLRASARRSSERASTLRAMDARDPATIGEILAEYRRLASLFTVTVTSFERKRYVNLSHEPNKAMNLNSYIALLGSRWREVRRSDGLHLERADDDPAALLVPDATYVVTLDADSLLAPDYALRLVHVLEQPGSERIAVAQTPYSAVPDAATDLERVAGATTDIQYILHQGYTRLSATFWVGANAVIRKAALADIATEDTERGYPISRFIQDRTVIEDTESSIDLVARGWSLVNYPERLSFSATPPDLGALIIQRRRWANGGLIILPKLLRYVVRHLFRTPRVLGEAFVRTHYLTSIAGANVALLLLLLLPFNERLVTVWLPLTAVPYFLLYARDLTHAGYRASDVVRVYALNLLLVPVNLAGVLKSIEQGITGRKIPFGRTPKVEGRTVVPWRYIVAELALLAVTLFGTTMDGVSGRWWQAAFGCANAALLLYAFSRFAGWRPSLADLRSQLPVRGR